LQVLILNSLASGRMSKGVCSRSIPEPKNKEELNAETLRAQRFGGEGGPSTLPSKLGVNRVNGMRHREKRWPFGSALGEQALRSSPRSSG